MSERRELDAAAVLPAGLRHRPQFVAWRRDPRTGKKPPYAPVSGEPIAHTAPHAAAWADFATAQAAWRTGATRFGDRYDGVGVVLHGVTGVVCLDLDDCITAAGVEPWAAALIAECGSATELSPSGEGVHIWGTCAPDTPVLTAKRLPVGMSGELYHGGGYLTLSARPVALDNGRLMEIAAPVPLRDLTAVVRRLAKLDAPLAGEPTNTGATPVSCDDGPTAECVAELPEWLQREVRRLEDKWAGDRSSVHHAQVGALVAEGYDHGSIGAVLIDLGGAAVDKFGDGERLEQEVERSAEKHRAKADARRAALADLLDGSHALFPVPDDLPPRPWIAPGLLLRGAVTALAARGGRGKSLFALHIAVMVASGAPWGHWRPKGAGRVAIVNAEDDRLELQRRLWAVHGPGGALAIDALPAAPLVAMGERGVERGPLFDALAAKQPDLIILDPLVSLLRVPDENSNAVLSQAMDVIIELARASDAAVLLVHHASKGAANGAAEDQFRGASAIVDRARIAISLDRPSKGESDRVLPVAERHAHRSFVRVVDAKANYAALSDEDRWLRIEGVHHPNGESYPRMTPRDLRLESQLREPADADVLTFIGTGAPDGGGWRVSHHSGREIWLRSALAAHFMLTEAAAKRVIERLAAEGRIAQAEERYVNEHRHGRTRKVWRVTVSAPRLTLVT